MGDIIDVLLRSMDGGFGLCCAVLCCVVLCCVVQDRGPFSRLGRLVAGGVFSGVLDLSPGCGQFAFFWRGLRSCTRKTQVLDTILWSGKLGWWSELIVSMLDDGVIYDAEVRFRGMSLVGWEPRWIFRLRWAFSRQV